MEIESLILCCGDSPSTAPKYIGPTIAIVGLNENRLIRVMGLSNWSVLYEFGYQLTMAPSSKPASGGGGGIHFESLVWDKRLNALLISSTARPFLASLALKTHAATVTGGSAGDDSIGMRMVDFLKGTRTLNVDYTGVGFGKKKKVIKLPSALYLIYIPFKEYLNFYDMKDAMLSFRTSPVIGSSTTPSSSSSIYAVQSKSVDMFSISASHALPSNFYSRPMLPIDESVMHLFATSSAAVGNGTAAAAVANGGASSSVSSSTVPAVTAPTSNISTAAASSSSATTATSSVAPASSHHGMPEEASNNSASANHHVSFSANTSTTFQEEKDPVIKHDPNAHVHFGPESLVLSSSGTKNHEKKASSSANGALGSKDTSRSGEIGDDGKYFETFKVSILFKLFYNNRL